MARQQGNAAVPTKSWHYVLLGAVIGGIWWSGIAEGSPTTPAWATVAWQATTTEPEPSRVVGHYRFTGGTAEVDALYAAIEDVVKDMNFIIRPIARNRLRKANIPSNELQISVSDGSIHVVRPGQAIVSAPADGSLIAWKGQDGDRFRVRHRLLDSDRLMQEFYGDGNHSVNIYAVRDGGSEVEVRTEIDADLLPKTLRYSMSYERRDP